MPENISESESDTDDIGEKNITRISSALIKEGYKEGISCGHDAAFQVSFDKGYEEALTSTFDYYVLKEILQNSKKYETILPSEMIHRLKNLDIANYEDVLKPETEGASTQSENLVELMKTIKIYFS